MNTQEFLEMYVHASSRIVERVDDDVVQYRFFRENGEWCFTGRDSLASHGTFMDFADEFDNISNEDIKALSAQIGGYIAFHCLRMDPMELPINQVYSEEEREFRRTGKRPETALIPEGGEKVIFLDK